MTVAELGWWVLQVLFWTMAILGAIILLIGLVAVGVQAIRAAITYKPAEQSEVGSQIVGHGASPYRTLGHVAAEVRRMKADGITRASIEYVLDQSY